ncbi:MAG: tetratricopeptide repeat protein, partial [bacterium]|nr:tetratricopeptide repeat protein [bacterium]
NLGQFYSKRKDYKKAIEYFKKAVSTNVNAKHIYLNIAANYEFAEDFENALEAWKKAVEYNPDNIDAKISLANAFVKTGDIQSAIRKIRGIYKDNKENKKVLLMYGVLLLDNDEPFEALEKFNKALEIEKDYEVAKFAKIECLVKIGKTYEADELLKPLEEKEESKDNADILYLRALVNKSYAEKENKRELIDTTIEICDKIIALHANIPYDISRVEAIKNNLINMKEN